jgi:hypothetical protein
MPEVAIVPFLLNTYESAYLDLRFGPGDSLRFRTSGVEISVHICGYLIGSYELERTEEDF